MHVSPSLVMAEAPARVSPVMSCRWGSVQTSWQTSAIRLAVKYLTSLWCRVGKPHVGQESACWTVKLDPQGQLVGRFDGSQPYLKVMASLNAPL